MSARRCAVVAAVSVLTASASAGAQMWSSPNMYCPIGASFCLEEYFAVSLGSANHERMFGIFPNNDVFKFEDFLSRRKNEFAPPGQEDGFIPPGLNKPRHRIPEFSDDVPRAPREEIPDDTPRHEEPEIPGKPTPDPRLEEPILTPEPSTLILLGATLPLALGFIRGRRKHR